MPCWGAAALLVVAGRRVSAPADPIEQVRWLYEAALVRFDYEAVAARLHPECEFRNPDHAIEPGVRHGPQEFCRVFENLNQMFEYEGAGIEEIRALDEKVVVTYRARGKSRASGIPIDQAFGHLWVFEGGKVKSLEWFATFEEALAAALP
jgi:ketosteroid isomerase-like protein